MSTKCRYTRAAGSSRCVPIVCADPEENPNNATPLPVLTAPPAGAGPYGLEMWSPGESDASLPELVLPPAGESSTSISSQEMPSSVATDQSLEQWVEDNWSPVSPAANISMTRIMTPPAAHPRRGIISVSSWPSGTIADASLASTEPWSVSSGSSVTVSSGDSAAPVDLDLSQSTRSTPGSPWRPEREPRLNDAQVQYLQAMSARSALVALGVPVTLLGHPTAPELTRRPGAEELSLRPGLMRLDLMPPQLYEQQRPVCDIYTRTRSRTARANVARSRSRSR